jgi:hypothetical protein
MGDVRLLVPQLHNFATDPTSALWDIALHEIADVEAEVSVALVRANHLANDITTSPIGSYHVLLVKQHPFG